MEDRRRAYVKRAEEAERRSQEAVRAEDVAVWARIAAGYRLLAYMTDRDAQAWSV